MDDFKARIAFLKAAMKTGAAEGVKSPDHLLRLAFVFECYAAFGLDAGLQTLDRVRMGGDHLLAAPFQGAVAQDVDQQGHEPGACAGLLH